MCITEKLVIAQADPEVKQKVRVNIQMPPHEQIQTQVSKDLKNWLCPIVLYIFLYVASRFISGLVMVTQGTHPSVSLIYVLHVFTTNLLTCTFYYLGCSFKLQLKIVVRR